jgi:hypothetical protein
MCLKAGWDFLANNKDQIKLIFTVIAAIFVTVEYFDAMQASRVKQTMEFQSRFGQSDIQKANFDLNLLLIDKKPELDAAGKGASARITELVKEQKLDRSALLITDFFVQVKTCIEGNVCDRKLACSLFADQIKAFHNNFNNLFESWRAQWGENFLAPSYDYFGKNCKT